MLHTHPLENPSLAPFGLAMPISQQRLKYASTNELWIDPEKLIARCWDKRNRAGAPRPLPVQAIIHEILPGMAQASRLAKGDFVFDGLPYLTRDIRILSSVVQWLGTNCGRCFLEDPIIGGVSHPEREFVEKLAKQQKLWNRMDLVAFWCHEHNARCAANRSSYFMENPCHYSSAGISARDRAVVDGLMRWLGREAGREFSAQYIARRNRASEATRDRRRVRMEKQAA